MNVKGYDGFDDVIFSWECIACLMTGKMTLFSLSRLRPTETKFMIEYLRRV
jgi:hypothetical protein